MDMDNVALKEIDQDNFKGRTVYDADIGGDRYITNKTEIRRTNKAEFHRICLNNTIDIEGVPSHDESTTTSTTTTRNV